MDNEDAFDDFLALASSDADFPPPSGQPAPPAPPVPSSPPFPSSSPQRESSPLSELLSDVELGQELDDLMQFDAEEAEAILSDGPQAQPQVAPTSKAPRLRTDMTTRDTIEFLRFLKRRHLSLVSVLKLLFHTEKPQRREVYPEGPDAPSSQPSGYRTDPHYLHVRVRVWLSGTGPQTVARRWTGMDAFAVEHVKFLVAKESKKALLNPYLAGPDATCVKHQDLSAYSMEEVANQLNVSCPATSTILHAIIGASTPDDLQPTLPPRKKQKLVHGIVPGDDLPDDASEAEQQTEQDDAVEEREEEPKRKEPAALWKRRGVRNKANVVYTIMLMLLFALSRRCNRFQQVFGLVLFAARAKKRPQELLARAGLSVSVKTVKAQAVALADDAMQRARDLLKNPATLFSLSVDNLNWLFKARGAVTTYRNAMMAAVAGKIYILDGTVRYSPDAPICDPALFKLIFGPDLAIPTYERRPINALTADGHPQACDRSRRDAYRASSLAAQDKSPFDFIVGEVDGQHLAEVAVFHALNDWLPRRSELVEFVERIQPPPQVFPFEPQKTKVVPMPVYDENEGSIGGNIKVLDRIREDFGLDEDALGRLIVPAVGDAFTADMQRRAIDRRSDDMTDKPEGDRLKFLHPWAAPFHFHMAYQKFFIETHAGSAGNMDLLSLRRLGSKANFKATGKIDFNDADAFMHTLFASLVDTIICKALRDAGHGALDPEDDADQTLVGEDGPMMTAAEATNGAAQPNDTDDAGDEDGQDQVDAENQSDAGADDEEQEAQPEPTTRSATTRSAKSASHRVETLAQPQGGPRRAGFIKDEFADLDWETFQPIVSAAVKQVMKGSADLACHDGDPTKADLLFGHALTLFRDLLVYIELRHSLKHGDTGRWFAMVRQALVRFQASGAKRYVAESLFMLNDLRFELPPALKQAMMAASIVNHSGRHDNFKAADLDIEHLVNDLKNVYPVHAKAGGLDRQRRIGEIHPLLAHLKDDLFRTFGISSLDKTHTHRDKTLTSRTISAELSRFAVFERQPSGRESPAFALFATERYKKRASKHTKADSVVVGMDGLIGTSSKQGSIASFWARRTEDTFEELNEESADNATFELTYDPQREMDEVDLDFD